MPETLHALIAARLDGLSRDERRLVGDASVLGKTFTSAALAVLSGTSQPELEPLLGGLVRKEVLGLQSDPRSPEHGQYGFLQDLLRQVAYDTLPKKERRTKHLQAAEHLSGAMTEEEVAEVVASHLLEAYRIEPDAADSAQLMTRAQLALVHAGERAASLGASTEARRYFEQAGDLEADAPTQASALFRAGEMAMIEGRAEEAGPLFERSIARYESVGDTHAAARVQSWLAFSEQTVGKLEVGIERMERAYEVVSGDAPDGDLAMLLFRLGQAHFFAGAPERALAWIEQSLDVAEALQLPEMLARGWSVKGAVIAARRPEEARVLIQQSLEMVLAHDAAAARRGDVCESLRPRLPARSLLRFPPGARATARVRAPDGQPAQRVVRAQRDDLRADHARTLGRGFRTAGRVARRHARTLRAALISPLGGARDPPEQGRPRRGTSAARPIRRSRSVRRRPGTFAYDAATAAVRLAEGNAVEALAKAEQAFDGRSALGIVGQDVKVGFLRGVEAALALGNVTKADELLTVVEELPVGLRPPLLDAAAHRFRARLAGDDPSADALFTRAAAQLRALELPFHLAVVLLEHGEWLAAQGRPDDAEPFVAEARETFERLEATPWLERLDAVRGGVPSGIPA